MKKRKMKKNITKIFILSNVKAAAVTRCANVHVHNKYVHLVSYIATRERRGKSFRSTAMHWSTSSTGIANVKKESSVCQPVKYES